MLIRREVMLELHIQDVAKRRTRLDVRAVRSLKRKKYPIVSIVNTGNVVFSTVA